MHVSMNEGLGPVLRFGANDPAVLGPGPPGAFQRPALSPLQTGSVWPALHGRAGRLTAQNCAGLLAWAERLRWLNEEFADVLRATLAALPDGALALQPLMARALQVRKTPSWPRSWANFSRS